jgi:hypothetical protein
MKKVNYVCTTCSSTFTRKASGFRHNSNMHLGTAGIVRLIDYIIGRVSGQYLHCNPRDFRLVRRERPSSKRDPSEPKTSFDNLLDSLSDYAKLKRAVNGNRNPDSFPGKPFLLDFERISNKTISTQNCDSYGYEQARAELVAIEQMLTHFYNNRKFALKTVISLINASNVRGNYRGIHEAFENHRRNIRNQFGNV